jgi:pheromone shutdown-related protein TraB
LNNDTPASKHAIQDVLVAVDSVSGAATSASAGDEPLVEVTAGGVHYTLLGTAHVSRTSAETVRRMAEGGDYDAIAIELCPSRHRALVDSDAWRNVDLFSILREGKAGMMMASLALSAYQTRVAEQLGIEAGADMRAAIAAASSTGRPLQLVDREIGTTLRRASHGLSLWKRWLMVNSLILSLVSREKITEEDIERLKEGDILAETFTEFSQNAPELHESLIAERDRYMAARLRQENDGHAGRRVLVVLGAGHLAGTSKALAGVDDAAAALRALDSLPPPSQILRALPWFVVAAVLGGFALGFSRSPELGWGLVATWVVVNGGLSALGALIARAHPLTVLTAMVAAPLTSLNPTVGAGMVTGAVEAWLRQPRVADFESLRDDVTSLAGWLRNRVAHVLAVFFLSNLGSAIGTWVAGFQIAQKLM